MSRHVVLDQVEEAFVDGLAAAGRFGSADHAIPETLRLLNTREARPTEVRDAWDEGCGSEGWQSAEPVVGNFDRRDPIDPQAGG